MTSKLDFTKSKAFTHRALAAIPGGTHTYSRGADRYPQNAPNGITHGKGAHIWDADGNEFIDWAMGLTAVSLGHAYPQVDDAVCETIRKGVIFQCTSQVELEAAETFLSCTNTDMVKFARHGSCVTSAAVKLARAYTGRACVAIPREHPFFSFDDWFIGTTPCDFGIPEELKRYTKLFSYNDIESVHRLFKENPDEIACIILEPVKFSPPENNFLQELRELCTEKGVVLIFDEMITGFRFDKPGACRYFGVEGDLYTYGKGMANGYAASALTGRGDIMRMGGVEPEGARKLFLLSTTHGGESVGMAAVTATLKVLADGTIIKKNWEIGENLRNRLNKIISNHSWMEKSELMVIHALCA